MGNESEAVQKWTDITLLPEWEEEFYHIYTARKHGKWVMLKTLKPAYKYKPEYQAMLEREFEVRYNLSHAHIVMINDFEDIPGLGRCIITDDVYGTSLRKLIDEHRVTPAIINKLTHQLVEAMDYIQTNHIVHHNITPSTIIFTDKIGNLKLIDVGFDQKKHIDQVDSNDDIKAFGEVLSQALDSCSEKFPHLQRIAARCCKGGFRDVQSLQLAIAHRSVPMVYALVAFVMLLIATAIVAAL